VLRGVDAPRIPALIISGRVTARRRPTLASDVELCYDARGEVLAYCSATHGTLRVDMPGVAEFRLEPGADAVIAAPHGSVTRDLLVETFQHCVLPLMLPALGIEALHASAVAGEAGVVAFCGASGVGKSTIAVALSRQGRLLCADDAVAIDVASSVPHVVPIPFTSRLRPESARLLGAVDAEPRRTAPEISGRLPLAAVCLLRRAPDASVAVAIDRLDAATASSGMLAHAYCFSVRDAARKRRTVGNYLTLATRVAVYEARFRPGPAAFPAILGALDEIVDGVVARTR